MRYLAIVVGLWAGCAEVTTDTNEPPTDPTGDTCPAGETYQWPGCETGGGFAEIAQGCYASCSGAADTSCEGDTTCTNAWVNPCVCAKGEDCCMACGSEQWLCL